MFKISYLYNIAIALFSVFYCSTIKAQEGKPEHPAKDEEVKEQTEQPSVQPEQDFSENIFNIEQNLERIKIEAESSGRNSGLRYQELLNDIEGRLSKVKRDIHELQSEVEVTEETSENIENEINIIESKIKLLEIELMAGEPGNPPEIKSFNKEKNKKFEKN